jgi:hypothetical protein
MTDDEGLVEVRAWWRPADVCVSEIPMTTTRTRRRRAELWGRRRRSAESCLSLLGDVRALLREVDD